MVGDSGRLGVVVALLSGTAFARGERWAWWALALGTALWFVLDTGVSVGHGVWPNVTINGGVAVLVAVPLLATWDQARML